MNLYPAIDLYEGQVVRLEKGDFEKKTVYSQDPETIARQWEEQGAKWLHIVDLEGAKTGILKNLPVIRKIRKTVKCKIQYGGGLRSVEAIETVISEGIDRAVMGTRALDETFFGKAISRFGSKIAVGLDVRDGKVQTQGWLEASGAELETALKHFNSTPLETVIYTDISKDGMLRGPNFEGLWQVLSWTRARVILSGGVTSLGDIEKCSVLTQKNFEGAIIGKALYEGKFKLTEAFRITSASS